MGDIDVFRGLRVFCIRKPELFVLHIALHFFHFKPQIHLCFGFDVFFFLDQKEAMATDGGKASGGEVGTKRKSSGSQVSQMSSLTQMVSHKCPLVCAPEALPDYCWALRCTVTCIHTVPVLTCYALQYFDKTFVTCVR